VLTPQDGTIPIILYGFFSCWTQAELCFPAEKGMYVRSCVVRLKSSII